MRGDDLSDLDLMCLIFNAAGIKYKIDAGGVSGWPTRLEIEGDRFFVFSNGGKLCGIRNEDDTESFDGDGVW